MRTTRTDAKVEYSHPARSIDVPAPPKPESVPEALRRELFDFRDLGAYTASERAFVRGAERTLHALICAIGPTMRWEYRGAEYLERLYRSGGRAIFSFWHNQIVYATWFGRGRNIVVMTSQSLDGEYIARFIQRFGYGAARGSSTRGAVRGLIGQVRAVEAGFDAAFAVDGPKGPRYQAKVGPAMLARKTGAAIVPMHNTCSSFWEVRSWDRLQIPRPFSRALVVMSEPISVAPDADDEALDAARLELERALESMRARYPRPDSG